MAKKNNYKRLRNIWLINGSIWVFISLRRLSMKGEHSFPIIFGITAIVCFVSAYISHKEAIKDNEN